MSSWVWNGRSGWSPITSAALRRAQRRIDVVVEPARVAELEAVAARGQLRRAPSRRRSRSQWKFAGSCHRTGPSLPASTSGSMRSWKRSHPCAEVRQPLDVGQVAAGLDGEHEVRRRLGGPVRDRVARGQPVEGVVDLDGREALRVVLEPAPRGSPSGRRSPASRRSSSPEQPIQTLHGEVGPCIACSLRRVPVAKTRPGLSLDRSPGTPCSE